MTFLYKLVRGVCSKSYGMNVATMAGLAAEIVATASQKATLYEATSQFGAIRQRRTIQLAQEEALRSIFQALDDTHSSEPEALLRIREVVSEVKSM